MKINISAGMLLMFIISTLALAGPSSSGGGMAVVCRDDKNNIRSAELLDVFEAKQDLKRVVMQPSGDLGEDYARLVKNTYTLSGHPEFFDPVEIQDHLKHFLGIVTWVSLPEKLPFLNDQGETVPIPSACSLEQLAVAFGSPINNDQKVQIQTEIWERLDSLNKAALIEHELFYYYERIYNEPTSETTRATIRQIVSEKGNIPVNSGVEKAKWMCFGFTTLPSPVHSEERDVTMFYVHQIQNHQGKEDAEFQFTSISGRSLLSKTTLRIPNFNFRPRNTYSTYNNHEPVVISSSSPDLTEVFPLDSEQRHWKVRFKYVEGEPIRLTLIHGQQETESVLFKCSVI